MRTNLPKISFLKLSLYVSELFLDSETWEADPRVLFGWHLLFFTSVGVSLLNLATHFFQKILENSPATTLIVRICNVVSFVAIIAILAVLASAYYQRLLLANRDLRFSSVAFFWLTWLVAYGCLYRFLYELTPALFTWIHPPYVPIPTHVDLPLSIRFQVLAAFTTYSACVATTLGFPYISSNSTIVSILNVTEVVGSLVFVTLVVATFAAKKASARRK